MDIRLQISDEQKNSQKDIKVMKTIHDLKNPLLAIQHAVQDTTMDIQQTRTLINAETMDLSEMLENLRAEFKCRHGMEFYEKPSPVVSATFVETFLHAHSNLAQNGENILELKLKQGFPLQLELQRMNVKRIVNNLITNSLKHTLNGKVRISISIEDGFNINNKTANYHHVGNNNLYKFIDLNYIAIEVEDSGSGIPPKKLPQVFNEKETDQSNGNWDGTGLGLSICAFICEKLGWSIRQNSEKNVRNVSVLDGDENNKDIFNTHFAL